MNLTGKDLRAYRELNKSSQRRFAFAFNMSRGTLAGYEWSGKELPQWIINKMVLFDPNFVEVCKTIRRTQHLMNHYQMKKENKSWLARFIGWLMGY